MKGRKKMDSREADLRFYLAVGKHLFKADDLHFGYWPADLPVDILNLPRAQENHSKLVISHIPEKVTTILDVGCGVGRMASRLVELGHQVEGVSPSAFLADEARRLLGDAFRIYECRFEDLQTESRYDLVLFSESFQYVQTKKALAKCLALLEAGGHLLICDYFQTGADGESPFKTGPSLGRFYELISRLPFEPVEDVDITNETAPTADIADGLIRNVGGPLWDILCARLESRQPLLAKLVRWKFKKKIARIEKHLSGARSGDNFKKFKSYRLLLYRKAPAAPPPGNAARGV